MYFNEESIYILYFYAYQHKILKAPKLNTNQGIIKYVMLQITCFSDE